LLVFDNEGTLVKHLKSNEIEHVVDPDVLTYLNLLAKDE
jgi:hypothetical protein